jgi:hypothetical protein
VPDIDSSNSDDLVEVYKYFGNEFSLNVVGGIELQNVYIRYEVFNL